MMVAQAMIEEVALPTDTVFPATYFFQFLIIVAIPGSRGNARMACKWSGMSKQSRQCHASFS